MNFAASIKAKVLLLPQERDEYFPPEQSNSMRNALKSAGNAPQLQMLGAEVWRAAFAADAGGRVYGDTGFPAEADRQLSCAGNG